MNEAWLRLEVLPLWGRHGLWESGCFAEALLWGEGEGEGEGERRVGEEEVQVRVQGRQIYVFARAALMGEVWGLEVARRGVEFLLHQGWGEKGWRRRLKGKGGAGVSKGWLLYDQACVVLGLVWYGRAVGGEVGEEMATWVVRTCEVVAGQAGGWRAGWGEEEGGWELDPLMHWFEAMLALWEWRKEKEVQNVLEEIYALLKERLFDEKEGCVWERYATDWREPLRGYGFAPGHLFEWGRLLYRWGERELSGRLVATAQRWSEGHVPNRVGGGEETPPRAWPQLERIGWLRQVGDGEGEQVASERFWRAYVEGVVPGLWRDCVGGEGQTPASGLYHLVAAEVEEVCHG